MLPIPLTKSFDWHYFLAGVSAMLPENAAHFLGFGAGTFLVFCFLLWFVISMMLITVFPDSPRCKKAIPTCRAGAWTLRGWGWRWGLSCREGGVSACTHPAHGQPQVKGLCPISSSFSQSSHALTGRLELTLCAVPLAAIPWPLALPGHCCIVQCHPAHCLSLEQPGDMRCHSEQLQHNGCCLGSGDVFSSSLLSIQFLWRGFPQGASSCIYPTTLLAGRRRSGPAR